MTNTKPRSVLTKVQNYRESNTINYSKCEIAIDSSIENIKTVLLV